MRVFLTGATGYIGGSVASELVTRGHTVRGMARDTRTFDGLRQLGIEPVQGGLDDIPTLTAEAEAADAVINAADSDHAGAVATLLEALKDTGKTLVHTSGSSIVGSAANGELDPTVYDEGIVDPSSSWRPDDYKLPRVAIDRSVVESQQSGVNGIVLCNTLIYGDGLGIKPDSVQLPRLVDRARRTGTAGHIGAGKNVWSNVHVEDVATLYAKAVETSATPGFYFVENGEASFSDMAAAIARRYGLGGPKAIDIDDAIADWGYEVAVFALGSNSRVRGGRARDAFGWQPRWSSVTAWIEGS